jgi:SET domain-containing protein
LFGLDNGIEVIDPTTGGNEARWINHSCHPNCEAIEEKGRVFIYALRNLQPGEELFYDYALQVDEPITKEVAEESRCFCGSSRCRGTMLEQKN